MLPVKTILFPTDYSADSEQAFSLACDLALSQGARLIAVHVVEPPLYSGEFNVPTPPSPFLQDNVDHWLKKCHPHREMPTVESRVVEGLAWEQIVRVAGDRQCDLIVMGSEGKTGIGRTLLGSVAERVARHAPCPVLICKQSARTETPASTEAGRPIFSTILFPADLSDRAQRAFSVALALAGPGSRLIVQHVVTAADHTSPEVKSALLKQLHELYPADSVAPVVYRLSGGDPAEEICRAVEDAHCDLIVMSSQGRTGVTRLLMGSVAEAVFRAVRVPVVLVHNANPEPVSKPEVVAKPDAESSMLL